MQLGIGIGRCFGLAYGTIVNIGIGLSLGIAIGLILGKYLDDLALKKDRLLAKLLNLRAYFTLISIFSKLTISPENIFLRMRVSISPL